MKKWKFKLTCLVGEMKWSGNSFSINKFQLEDVPIEKFNCDIKSKNQTLEVNKTRREK